MKTRKVALFGNVNTDEIIAKRLISEGATVDGYLFSPNNAFSKICRKSIMLSEKDVSYRNNGLIDKLREENYDVVLLGPDFTVGLMSQILKQSKIPHIGATPDQLLFETDKSLISDAVNQDMIPHRRVLTTTDREVLRGIIADFNNNYVLKFVGDYSKKYPGSHVGRVRLSDETVLNVDETYTFIVNSIDVSGKCIIEEKLVGKEFSSNYAVDKHGAFFRLGENVCYKRRFNKNTGPMCDGTGSVSLHNSLPFLTQEDIDKVENRILVPFLTHIKMVTGQVLSTIINLDLMKTNDGRIVLFEVNCREAGGHSMANILSGLATPLIDILERTQNGALHSLTPSYSNGVSLVVSAYPPYFPFGTDDDHLVTCTITTQLPTDVSLYTGWVDVLKETEEYRVLKMQNSPTLLFEHRNETMKKARKYLYSVINNIVPFPMEFRTDIGEDFI